MRKMIIRVLVRMRVKFRLRSDSGQGLDESRGQFVGHSLDEGQDQGAGKERDSV